MTEFRIRPIAGTMLCSAIALATPAMAQMAPDTGGSKDHTIGAELQEVVVTALRRRENLQDVAADITAISGATLQAEGAKDYRDYINKVPGVNFTDAGYRGSAITIHGIADGNMGVTSPLTSIYIDEAPVSEVNAPTFDPDLYDVERIEVLKGPQGTLYGGGSMGGTVRVILNKPDLGAAKEEVETLVGDVAHGGVDWTANGLINVPLVKDVLGLRITASRRDDDGYIDNVFTGKSNVNTVRKTNFRGALRLKPNDSTTIDLGYLYQKEELAAPNFATKGLGPYQQHYVYDQTGPSTTKLSSLTVTEELGFASLISATNYLDRYSSANVDATASFHDLLSFLTGIDIPPDQGLGIITSAKIDLFTQEVRLASTGGSPLHWLIGGFYSSRKISDLQGVDLSQAPSLGAVLTGPETYLETDTQHGRQLAGFGELTYDVTEKWSGTAGLRASDISSSLSGSTTGLLNGGTSPNYGRADASAVTQKYVLKYKATPQHLLYAQASEGFREGGSNQPVPLSICGEDLASLGYSSAPTQYRPDKLWDYEIGSKNEFLDHRLTVNGAAYYVNWTDIQNEIGLPTCLFDFVNNAGKAVSKGVDLAITAEPARGFTVSGALSYVNATLTQSAPGITARAGDPLPYAPRWSWSASAQYAVPVGASSDLALLADVAHQGTRWNGFRSESSLVSFQMPAYTTVGARIELNHGPWSVAIFGTNLLDARIVTSRTAQYDVLGVPREVGLDLKADF